MGKFQMMMPKLHYLIYSAGLTRPPARNLQVFGRRTGVDDGTGIVTAAIYQPTAIDTHKHRSHCGTGSAKRYLNPFWEARILFVT
ncbi:hypothetical protein Rcae01_05534 [Novipirellula caenicola]|uniref:Uncharacterized protein n=1 Tax=Novipirellula caenicola TaxID=1536901 RepID=A0ABP9VY17_9BACT